MWELVAKCIAVVVIGLIYLGSTNTCNAIAITAGEVILQHVSFGFSTALPLVSVRASRLLPSSGKFTPRVFMWIAIVSGCVGGDCTGYYCFLGEMPVMAKNTSKHYRAYRASCPFDTGDASTDEGISAPGTSVPDTIVVGSVVREVITKNGERTRSSDNSGEHQRLSHSLQCISHLFC